jgi:uracil-DNA glycosylase family 4
VVLLRGTVPAPFLFIGEGPGDSEDVLGKPFIGPAGKLLDEMVERVGFTEGTTAFTNLIACVPRSPETKKIGSPPQFAIEACRDRLREVYLLVKPQVVVLVGKEAEVYAPTNCIGEHDQFMPRFVPILHPGAIIKMHIAQQGLAMQRTITVLSEAWDNYLNQ